jgi:hypothetical protein
VGKRGGGRGKKGGEMTQTLYAHMHKKKRKGGGGENKDTLNRASNNSAPDIRNQVK